MTTDEHTPDARARLRRVVALGSLYTAQCSIVSAHVRGPGQTCAARSAARAAAQRRSPASTHQPPRPRAQETHHYYAARRVRAAQGEAAADFLEEIHAPHFDPPYQPLL